MPGSTGPDLNTFQIPEVQLGDTFNLWRDTTNTGIYKLNKLKVYDVANSESNTINLASGGTFSVSLADNVNKGVTFNYGVAFEAGVTFDETVVFQKGVTFNGDVTFNAQTFTVNASVVTIDDYNIILGDTASASDSNISAAGGGGILIKRGSGQTASWVWNPVNFVGRTGEWETDSHIAINGNTYGIIPHNNDLLPVYGLRLGVEGGSTTDHGLEFKLTNVGANGSTSARAIQFVRTSPAGNTAFMEILAGPTYGAWPQTNIYAGVNKKIITQSSHGLGFGNPVYMDGSLYKKAIADSAIRAEVVGVVSRVIDANNFELIFLGEIFGDFSTITEGGSALTTGSVYYLSPFSQGRITPSSPIAPGQVHKAVLIATSSTSAVILPFTGGVLSSTTNITTSTSLGVKISQLNQFKVGDFVRWKPGSTTLTYGATSGTYSEGIYVKAQANSDSEAEVAGMIVSTEDLAGTGTPSGINGAFTVLMDGFFQGLSLPSQFGQIQSGTVYFLNTNCVGASNSLESNTPAFTSSYPVGSGIRKPLFMATTSNEAYFSGYLFSYRGDKFDLSGISSDYPLESLLIKNLGSCGGIEDLSFGIRDGNGTAGGTKVMRFPKDRIGSVEIGYFGVATPLKGATLDVRGPIRAGSAESTTGTDIIVSRYNESPANNSSYPETLNVFGSANSTGNSVITHGLRPKAGGVGYLSSTAAVTTKRTAFEVGTTLGDPGIIVKVTASSGAAVGTELPTTEIFSVTDERMLYNQASLNTTSVGFGTGNPNGNLNLYANNPVLNIENTNASANSGAVLRFGHDQGSDRRPAGEIRTLLQNGSAAGRAADMQFCVAAAGATVEMLRLASSGSVGIGRAPTTSTVGLDIHHSVIRFGAPVVGANNISLLLGGDTTQRYLTLLDDSGVNANGIKVGGLLVSDSYAYANPARNNAVIKGNLCVGTATNTHALNVNGNLLFSGIRDSVIGVYDPENTQAVWTMGNAYRLTGTTTGDYGNFYGLAWSYNPDYTVAGNNPQSKPGLSHQLLLMMGGTTRTAIGQGIWTAGNITAQGNLTVGSSPFAWDGVWPQCVMTHVARSYTYQPNYQLPYSTFTAENSTGKLTILDTSITPRRASSKILYTANIQCEMTENCVFRLYRKVGTTVTELGPVDTTQPSVAQLKTYGGNLTQYYGMKVLNYEPDYNSTMTTVMINYLDSPNTTSAVTYFVVAFSANNTTVLHLNKTAADANNLGNNAAHWAYERTTSQVILQEYFA